MEQQKQDRPDGKTIKIWKDHLQDEIDTGFLYSVFALARESAMHTESLQELTGTTEEPWHKTESGGMVGNIVYGFNDGLTANFGLVAGVIAATSDISTILVTGIVGTVADALSMGASGYLAAKFAVGLTCSL